MNFIDFTNIDISTLFENRNLVFKQGPLIKKEYHASICALLNTGKGQLVLGLTDNKNILGVADVNKSLSSIDSFIKHGYVRTCDGEKLKKENIVAFPVKNNDNYLIIINITASQGKRYKLKSGAIYERLNFSNRLINGHEMKEQKEKRKTVKRKIEEVYTEEIENLKDKVLMLENEIIRLKA